jgi:hypothetical protein
MHCSCYSKIVSFQIPPPPQEPKVQGVAALADHTVLTIYRHRISLTRNTIVCFFRVHKYLSVLKQNMVYPHTLVSKWEIFRLKIGWRRTAWSFKTICYSGKSGGVPRADSSKHHNLKYTKRELRWVSLHSTVCLYSVSCAGHVMVHLHRGGVVLRCDVFTGWHKLTCKERRFAKTHISVGPRLSVTSTCDNCRLS